MKDTMVINKWSFQWTLRWIMTSFLTVSIAMKDSKESECFKHAERRNLEYAKMCENGTLTGLNLVIDTFQSSSYDQGSCTCDIKWESKTTVLLNVLDDLQPNSLTCGGKIKFTHGDNENVYECNISANTVDDIDMGTLIWTSDQDDGNSEYCVILRSRENATVTCYSPSTSVTPHSTPEDQTIHVSLDGVSTTSDVTTGSTSAVTVTSSTRTTPSTTWRKTDHTPNEEQTLFLSTETSILGDRHRIVQKLDVETLIIGGAIGGAAFLLIIIIIGIVCFRYQKKKERLYQQQKNISAVEQNELYMSGREIQTGQEQQQHPQDGAYENIRDIRTEHQPGNYRDDNIRTEPIDQPDAVYSVVNKQRRESTTAPVTSSADRNDGLNYADLADFSANNNPDLPRVKPISNDDGNVLYSEIVKC